MLNQQRIKAGFHFRCVNVTECVSGAKQVSDQTFCRTEKLWLTKLTAELGVKTMNIQVAVGQLVKQLSMTFRINV